MRLAAVAEERDAARAALASPDLIGHPRAGDCDRPIRQRERELIQQRCDNHEAGLNVGLTDRAVFALRGYEAALSAALASPAPEAPSEEVWELAARICENRSETLPPVEANEARKCARAIRAKLGVNARFRPAHRAPEPPAETPPIKSLRELDETYFPSIVDRAEAEGDYERALSAALPALREGQCYCTPDASCHLHGAAIPADRVAEGER